VQQRQQNRYRLLLKPGQHKRKRQFVYAAIKCLCQPGCNLNRRICVIALPTIQQPRNAFDVAEFELVEAELASRQRQDYTIVRHFLCQVSIVVPSGLGTVTAADQEEMPDFPLFDQFDYPFGCAEHGITGKTNR